MTSPWKSYRVSFSVRDCYVIDVKARSEDEASEKVHDLYDRYGEDPKYGFIFDLSDGGTDGWYAELLTHESTTNA